MPEFQWDDANRTHVLEHYPDRANTIDEVESLFNDPAFAPLPDRVDSYGEQRYKVVACSNRNRIMYVAFSVRNGQIRPISCRPASRKERERYAQITQKPE